MVNTRRKSYGQGSPPVPAPAAATNNNNNNNNNNAVNDSDTPPRRSRKVSEIDKEINRLFKDLETAVQAQANLAPHDAASRDLHSHHIAGIYKSLLVLVNERIQGANGGGAAIHIDTPVPAARRNKNDLPNVRSLAEVDQDVLSVYSFFQAKIKEQKKKRSPSGVDSRLLGESILFTQQRLLDFIQERIRLQEVEAVSASLSGFSLGSTFTTQQQENTTRGSSGARRRVSFADRLGGKRSSNVMQSQGSAGSTITPASNTPSTTSASSFGYPPTPAPTAGFTTSTTASASVPPPSSGLSFSFGSTTQGQDTAAATLSGGGFSFGRASPPSASYADMEAPTAAATSSRPRGGGFSFGSTSPPSKTYADPPAAAATSSGGGFSFGRPVPTSASNVDAPPTAPSGFYFGATATPAEAPTAAASDFSFGRPVPTSASNVDAPPTAPSGFYFGATATPAEAPTAASTFAAGSSANHSSSLNGLYGGSALPLAQAMERMTEFGIAERRLPESLSLFARQSSAPSHHLQDDVHQTSPSAFSTRSDQAVRSVASSLARSSLGSVPGDTPLSGRRRFVRGRRMS